MEDLGKHMWSHTLNYGLEYAQAGWDEQVRS